MPSIQRRVRPGRDGEPGEVSYRVRYRGNDGTERSKSFKRKTDAERWSATQMASIAKGEWVDPHESRVSFGEWMPQWELTLHHLRPLYAKEVLRSPMPIKHVSGPESERVGSGLTVTPAHQYGRWRTCFDPWRNALQ